MEREMKIHLTKKEYALLVEMVLTARNIIQSQVIEDVPNETKGEYKNIENKIFTYAHDFGLKDQFKKSQDGETLAPTNEYLSSSFSTEITENYSINYFWDTLITCFTDKEMVEAHGYDTYSQMTEEQRKEVSEQTRQKYQKEFDYNGIKNLIFKNIKP